MTLQIETWKSEFGDNYAGRNDVTTERILGKTRVWAKILEAFGGDLPTSILEVGANVGLNIRALQAVTGAEIFAVEPNDTARGRLVDDGTLSPDKVFSGSAADLPFSDGSVDLVFTSTVLIHVAPDDLLKACREIHRVASRFILSNEYFAAAPEAITYRGREDLLFKRDFGAFWLDNFNDLRLLDYGFFWKRAAAMDDTTWWLFEKR